jgi:hypothetical protein
VIALDERGTSNGIFCFGVTCGRNFRHFDLRRPAYGDDFLSRAQVDGSFSAGHNFERLPEWRWDAQGDLRAPSNNVLRQQPADITAVA